jgi:hypothetical protein
MSGAAILGRRWDLLIFAGDGRVAKKRAAS